MDAYSTGEFGLYRIVFAGLSEADDPHIRDALRDMYVRFHKFIRRHIAEQRDGQSAGSLPDASLSAWAVIGLGTLADIARELGLLSGRQRKRLIAGVWGADSGRKDGVVFLDRV